MARVEMDHTRLYKKLDTSFVKLGDRLLTAARQELKNPIYKWPNETARKNNTTVGSPRDIFDTGELYSSAYTSILVSSNSSTLVFGFNAEYAYLVHEGGFLKNGHYYTARPFLKNVVKLGNGNFSNKKARIDVRRTYKEIYLKAK